MVVKTVCTFAASAVAATPSPGHTSSNSVSGASAVQALSYMSQEFAEQPTPTSLALSALYDNNQNIHTTAESSASTTSKTANTIT